jgi:putative FmdB family regulatory protein
VPTYDYECEACKGRFEIFHPMSETRTKCPKCGRSGLKRQIGPGSGFLFRGSGFYITDYRSSDYMSKAKADSQPSKSSETSASGSSSGGSSPDKGSKKKESAPAKS